LKRGEAYAPLLLLRQVIPTYIPGPILLSLSQYLLGAFLDNKIFLSRLLFIYIYISFLDAFLGGGAQGLLLELQLRGSATDSYGSLDPSAETRLQLVGNRVIGIRIYRAQMPAFVGKQLKQLNLFNLFHAVHILLPYL
jgi:hypothetical protein